MKAARSHVGIVIPYGSTTTLTNFHPETPDGNLLGTETTPPGQRFPFLGGRLEDVPFLFKNPLRKQFTLGD
jgi:hypothetical protein